MENKKVKINTVEDSNNDINQTIKKAIREAIREFDKEKKEEKKMKVFHNTRLLLKHYNDLKSHVNKAIDDAKRLESGLEELGDLDRDELYILSIKRSKSKTLIMIAHIDVSLETLEKKQIKLCSQEKFLALKGYFFEEKTYEHIAEELNCGVITARRWVNEMINELSIYLFGIDGLKLDMIS